MKFFKIIALCFALMFVVSCTQSESTKLIRDPQFIALSPPSSLFKCTNIKRSDIPDFRKLNDKQVANFVVKMKKKLDICNVSQSQVKKWIAAAKAKLNKK